jgi:hypothetical protein
MRALQHHRLLWVKTELSLSLQHVSSLEPTTASLTQRIPVGSETNYHFRLDIRLLHKLESTVPSRVVVLSSSLHVSAPQPEGIRFDKINEPKGYNEWTAFGQSNLASILFARRLNKVLEV